MSLQPHSAELHPIGFAAHLTFFDRDNDLKISLRETQRGLERIGLGHLIALPATAMIHAGVAGLGVVRGSLLNPLALSIPRASVLRHPDTALVDQQATFVHARLDEAYSQYALQYPGEALTLVEIATMAAARLQQHTRGLFQWLLLPGGVAGTLIEWVALFWLAGELRDRQRVLTKQAVLRFYTDAGFFHEVASQLERQRQQRAGSARGQLRNLVQTWLL